MSIPSPTAYQTDLAYIHDVGFGDYARKAVPGILALLCQHQIQAGLIVDLGCGSGLVTQALIQNNYSVLGVDISPAMIQIAQAKVPQARFQVGSLFQVEIPPCVSVISIGECLNYCFDGDRDRASLTQLFQRIYASLATGGLFIFDIVEPGQIPANTVVKHFTEGEDWLVLVEKFEDLAQTLLTRRIITFRREQSQTSASSPPLYRRSEEIHRQRLYQATEIAQDLRQVGFEVESGDRYGDFPLPRARTAFVARKPTPTDHHSTTAQSIQEGHCSAYNQ
jgi:SAM-dependent methyltransferase